MERSGELIRTESQHYEDAGAVKKKLYGIEGWTKKEIRQEQDRDVVIETTTRFVREHKTNEGKEES